MGITPRDAADALRGPLESGKIDAEARRWRLPIAVYTPPYELDLDEPLEPGDFTPMTLSDWQRVDWGTGTLDGAPIRVKRDQVMKMLKRLLHRPKRPPGRRAKYDWGRADAYLRKKLAGGRFPIKGDGKQAALEKGVAALFTPGPEPSESLIRRHVRAELDKMRAELEGH
jgi:hypothetical protein